MSVLREFMIIGGAGFLAILTITLAGVAVGIAVKPKVMKKEVVYYRDTEGRIIKVEEMIWTEWVENE